jgi:hypothetical protein
MIEARALALILTAILVVTVGGLPAAAANDSPRFPIAQQSELQSKLHTLIDKLRGVDMPAALSKRTDESRQPRSTLPPNIPVGSRA